MVQNIHSSPLPPTDHSTSPLNAAGDITIGLPQSPPVLPLQQLGGYLPKLLHGSSDALPQSSQPEELGGDRGSVGMAGGEGDARGESFTNSLHFFHEFEQYSIKFST